MQEPALCSKPDGLLKLAGMGCVKLEKVTERNWWEYWEGRRNDNLKFERSREESLKVTCETELWEEHGRTLFLVWGQARTALELAEV